MFVMDTTMKFTVGDGWQLVSWKKDGSCPRAFRESWPCQLCDLGSSLQNSEKINFSCFKPLSSWHFFSRSPRKLVIEVGLRVQLNLKGRALVSWV
jgi:hypothetical protein